jgi:hypothetical protein
MAAQRKLKSGEEIRKINRHGDVSDFRRNVLHIVLPS